MAEPTPMTRPRMHLPLLLLGLALMLGLTAYPTLLADAAGKADHLAATAAFWAMSAAFVRGVGFVPRTRVLAWLLGGYAALAALALALLALWR